jgi:hypothetical protein
VRGPGHQIDPGVLRVDPLLARPVGVHPDVLVQVLVARLVGEVALDEPLEVGPLLTLALGKGAVLGKKDRGCDRFGHTLRSDGLRQRGVRA